MGVLASTLAGLVFFLILALFLLQTLLRILERFELEWEHLFAIAKMEDIGVELKTFSFFQRANFDYLHLEHWRGNDYVAITCSTLEPTGRGSRYIWTSFWRRNSSWNHEIGYGFVPWHCWTVSSESRQDKSQFLRTSILEGQFSKLNAFQALLSKVCRNK